MKKFFEMLAILAKITIVLLLVWMYIKAWINAYKEGKYLKFILLSIIPVICFYYMQHQMLYGHPPKGWDNPYMSYDDCTCK